MREERSRAWREVDLNALAHNARVLQGALAPGCHLMAVVKADAYGHGAIPVARRLEAKGVKAFAVACLEEGIALRRSGVQGKILILGYTPPEMASQICQWKLIQAVVDQDHGRALAAKVCRFQSTWRWIPVCTAWVFRRRIIRLYAVCMNCPI